MFVKGNQNQKYFERKSRHSQTYMHNWSNFDQLDKKIDDILDGGDSICLYDSSQKSANHVVGYVVHKL